MSVEEKSWSTVEFASKIGNKCTDAPTIFFFLDTKSVLLEFEMSYLISIYIRSLLLQQEKKDDKTLVFKELSEKNVFISKTEYAQVDIWHEIHVRLHLCIERDEKYIPYTGEPSGSELCPLR